MEHEELPRSIALHTQWTDHASRNLASRIEQFKGRNKRIELDARVAAIQSLRGVAARASFVLPALYLALGGGSQPRTDGQPHWQTVRAAAMEQAALQTIALACRAVFDDSRKGLSGSTIARLSDESLIQVAEYWAERSLRPAYDATQALELLRLLFRRCARPARILLDQPSMLERRIGLLKYFADRDAAHISLDDYLFDVVDLVHVSAAIVIIGAIIADFDGRTNSDEEGYFDSIDEDAWFAAKQIFPHLPVERVFRGWSIHRQAALNWKWSVPDGVEYILNQLPAAIGYCESDRTHEARAVP